MVIGCNKKINLVIIIIIIIISKKINSYSIFVKHRELKFYLFLSIKKKTNINEKYEEELFAQSLVLFFMIINFVDDVDLN